MTNEMNNNTTETIIETTEIVEKNVKRGTGIVALVATGVLAIAGVGAALYVNKKNRKKHMIDVPEKTETVEAEVVSDEQ